MRAQSSYDRRKAARYPLQLVLEYRSRSEDGSLQIGQGATQDISTKAVLFGAGVLLPGGAVVELSIRWPIDQPEMRPLRLRIRGTVLRSEPRGVVVLISRYLLSPAS